MQWKFFLGAMLAVSGTAMAQPFAMNGTTYDVQDVAGTGADKAVLEVDFGTAASPQAFLFGYQWDGTTVPTGRDVLTALEANADGLSFTDTYYAGFDEHLLNTLWYQSRQPVDHYPSSFWLYFTSTNGQTFSESDNGYDATPVINGDIYGWAWQQDDPNEDRDYSLPPLPPSHFPAAIVNGIAPVPEPATLGVMTLGAAMMLRRKR